MATQWGDEVGLIFEATVRKVLLKWLGERDSNVPRLLTERMVTYTELELSQDMDLLHLGI